MLTPDINNPKAAPSFIGLSMRRSVGAASYKDPGLVGLEKPSKKTTNMRETVDTIPTADAYEMSRRGINIVGKRLDER